MSKIIVTAPRVQSGGDIKVPKDYVDGLVSNYRNLHHAYMATNSTIGANTIFAKFDMDPLIAALQDMKTDGANQCRIYIGAHDSYEPVGSYDYKHKITLIFVGTQVPDTGCPVELLDNDTQLAYDFGTLCPPQCSDACCGDTVASRIYGSGLCP